MKREGTLTITTRAANGMVECLLTDTGPGIPLEIQNTLFEPFVTCGKASGTGLGLVIAKKSVQDHRGTIGVKSIPGQGATLIIRLPRTRPGA